MPALLHAHSQRPGVGLTLGVPRLIIPFIRMFTSACSRAKLYRYRKQSFNYHCSLRRFFLKLLSAGSFDAPFRVREARLGAHDVTTAPTE